MIGKICVSIFQYYDSQARRMRFKNRPVLIIGQADSGDYVALPISKVSDKTRIHSVYDIKVESTIYPKLCLSEPVSYVRTHKQMITNKASIRKTVSDLKSEYPELFLEIIAGVEDFQKKMIDASLL